MSKVYRCSIEVRGYELDSFGHVNHAVYISYLEHARWKALEEENIRLANFQEWKRWPVIAQLEVSYWKPTFLGEQLVVATEVSQSGRTYFTAEQTIFRGEEQVLKGKVKIVIVNENGRPADMPAEVGRLWGAT